MDEDGRLLNFDERVRYYRANIEFEDFNAIEYSFGITQNFILNKVKRNLLPHIVN